MNDTGASGGASAPAGSPAGPFIAAALAWLLPGAGHYWLGRRARGGIFFVLVLLAIAFGSFLDGRLPWIWSGSPLQILATAGCMGAGLPFFILRFGVGHEGSLESAGYEYGSAFLLTAGLMNLLLMLDAWDIARGDKE